MHSLEIYSIRSYDRLLSGEKYAFLEDMRGHNLADLVYEILDKQSSFVDYRKIVRNADPSRNLKDIPPRVYKCSNITKKDNVVTGIINVGEYGTKNAIIGRIDGAQKGVVEVDDSVIKQHHFYLEVRPNQRQAILFLNAINGKGIKSIFETLVVKSIKQKTSGLICQIRPLAPKRLVQQWLENSSICEFKISNFTSNSPLSDFSDRLGDAYAEVTVKPKKRKARLGNIAELDTALVDVWKKQATTVKAVIEYKGRKRLFNIGSDEAPVNSIELDPEDPVLRFEDGNPTLDTVSKFAANLSEDIWTTNFLGD